MYIYIKIDKIKIYYITLKNAQLIKINSHLNFFLILILFITNNPLHALKRLTIAKLNNSLKNSFI